MEKVAVKVVEKLVEEAVKIAEEYVKGGCEKEFTQIVSEVVNELLDKVNQVAKKYF